MSIRGTVEVEGGCTKNGWQGRLPRRPILRNIIGDDAEVVPIHARWRKLESGAIPVAMIGFRAIVSA